MIKIYTFNAHSECRLDELLRRELPPALGVRGDEASNSKIRRLIVAGAVRIAGRQCRIPSGNVRAGCSVSVSVDDTRFFYEKQPDDIKFDVTKESVLYEDDALIIVNKPAFFPTEATIAGQRDNMHDAVVRWLWSENPSLRNPPYAGIMHRLDRETSGVLLFTKQRTANGPVHDMFEQHTARKVYCAAVCMPPRLPPEQFFQDDFLGRISLKSSAGKWGAVPESRGGLHAHTDFIVTGTSTIGGIRVLLIEAHPLTGRTHQIRVHLSGLGMPILGDELYGGSKAPRMFLHASSLTFPHPVSGIVMTVSAPLPPEFSV